MTIQEILEAHLRVKGQRGLSVLCICGWRWSLVSAGKRAEDLHRAHVAEVLDKHMQEREVEAWQEGFESGRWYDLDDMEPKNPYASTQTRN